MEPKRWRQLEEIFQSALELPEEQRESYIAAASGADEALHNELRDLLSAHVSSGSFLEEPVVEGGISQLIREQEDDFKSRKIGPYRLLKKLGEGGMSRVYLAVRDDDEYQKLVALKVIPQDLDGEELRRRFRTERQILASLDHPNIAKLLDGGTTEGGAPYFVMDYIEGVPIDEYCSTSRLSVVDRLELFRTVCAAVQYAHQNLVVHRDIKASNILVAEDGTPKLLDFGIAKLLKPEAFAARVEFTATRIRPMTPSYASPEQIRGRHITTATDVYSLGVLLYKLLTGTLPHQLEKKSPREVEEAILEVEPERPSTVVSRFDSVDTVSTELTTATSAEETPAIRPAQLRRRLSGDLDNIAMMALRKEPQRRYASVEMLSEDVRRHIAGLPVVAHRDSLGYRTGKFIRRNRLALAVGAAFVLLLLGFAGTMAIQARRLAQERDQAQRERDRAEEVVSFLQEIFSLSDPEQVGGDEITAREILDRGRRRIDTELAGQPIVQASLMEAIGNVYSKLGLVEWAEGALRRSLDLRLEHLGSDDAQVAQSQDSLGVLLRERGEYDEADELLQQSLETRRRVFGEEHPLVARSLLHLAQVSYDKGEAYESAERYFRQALDVLGRALGVGDPALTDIQSELGILLVQTGRFDEAEENFRQALTTRRRELGDDNPRTAESANNLAVFLGIVGRYEEALPLFRESLDTRLAILGPDHPDTGESLNNVGRLLRETGDLAGAEELYRQGLEIWRSHFGDGSPRVAFMMNNLGLVLLEQGDLDEAETYLRRALSVRREALDPDSPDLGWSLTGLGRLYLARYDPSAAEPYIHEAIGLYEASFETPHWRTAEARALLGELRVQRGQYDQAERLLLEGYEFVLENFHEGHRRTRDAAARVVRLYEAWGKPSEAAEYRAKLGP